MISPGGRPRQRCYPLDGLAQVDICYATTNRQDAVRETARRSQPVLVLGSQNSSNSHRLAEVAEKCGPPAYLVNDVTAVDLRWLAGVRRVGITAEASAPPHLVDELVRCLSSLGPITVGDATVADEDVQFAPPHRGELRWRRRCATCAYPRRETTRTAVGS